MTYLDLFSGTGGFALGLQRAGFVFSRCYFSETDKHAVANYKYNFPYATNIGSVEHVLSAGIERPNVITFGSPCQDFSTAGKRSGLAGKKSSFIQHAIAAVTHFRPNFFIWENVKGVFSTNAGADFWAVIQAFANIGGYQLEWQLLNTSWLLPQNRERVYLVGRLAEKCTKAVFPIESTDTGNLSIKAKERVAHTITSNLAKHPNDANYIVGDFRNDDGFRWRINGLTPCIKARNRTDVHGVPLVLTSARGFNKGALSPICPCIAGRTFKDNSQIIQINPSKESNGQQPYMQNRIYDIHGLSPALTTFCGKYNTLNKSGVRRLTEIECERLQGFPDNWTKWGIYPAKKREIKSLPGVIIAENNTDYIKREVAAGHRYELCGNAVTVDVVEMVAKRIKEHTQ